MAAVTAALNVAVIGRDDERRLAVIERVDQPRQAAVGLGDDLKVLRRFAAEVVPRLVGRRETRDEQSAMLAGEKRDHVPADLRLPFNQALGARRRAKLLIERAHLIA